MPKFSAWLEKSHAPLPSINADTDGISVEDLAERLGIQVRAMREKPNRVLSTTEAASMLHLRKSVVIQ
ncbi:MAG: hypothetical protein NVS9B5_20810 [Terriglobales bacterium]